MTILEKREQLLTRKRFLSLPKWNTTSTGTTGSSSNRSKTNANAVTVQHEASGIVSSLLPVVSTSTAISGAAETPAVTAITTTTAMTATTTTTVAAATTDRSQHRSNAMKRLLWTLQRNYQRQRSYCSNHDGGRPINLLYIDPTVYVVMKLEVQALLTNNSMYDIQTTPFLLIDAIVSSRNILNEYAESTSTTATTTTTLYDDDDHYNNYNNSIDANDYQSTRSTNATSRNIVVRRFGNGNAQQRHHHRSRVPYMYSTSTQRRYDFINTLNRLQQQQVNTRSSLSESSTIQCWDDAKRILSKVLQFPDEDIRTPLDTEEGLGETSPNISTTNDNETTPIESTHQGTTTTTTTSASSTERFIQRLRDIRLEEMSPPSLLLRPSQYKWIQVASTVISKPYDEEEVVKEDVDTAAVSEEEEDVTESSSSLRPFFRTLTEEEQQRISEVMSYGNGHYDTDVVARFEDDTDSVQRSNLRTLLPQEWVNDEVIHYYLTLLQKRDEDLCFASPTNRRRTHFFKSFFITKLLDEGNSNPELAGKYNYNNVKRWSKKVPGKDIFALKKIFFPINEGNQHWTSAVIDMEEQRIQYYDSLGGSGRRYLQVLFQYIQDEHLDKKKVPLKCPELWTLVPCTNDTPRQHNGFDCGVFTCLFADFLSIDKSFQGFESHRDMPIYREHLALSIIDGKIIS